MGGVCDTFFCLLITLAIDDTLGEGWAVPFVECDLCDECDAGDECDACGINFLGGAAGGGEGGLVVRSASLGAGIVVAVVAVVAVSANAVALVGALGSVVIFVGIVGVPAGVTGITAEVPADVPTMDWGDEVTGAGIGPFCLPEKR
ncbi:hypothetical protein CCP3SC15_430008 [Gammaproteobacteria bacterium]